MTGGVSIKTRALLLSTLCIALTAPPVAARADATASLADVGEANVALVKAFLTDVRAAMASHDPAKIRSVAERYMADDYTQHSTMFAPGREGYIARLIQIAAAPLAGAGGQPPPPRDLVFVGNRNYVTWMSEVPTADGKKHFAFNMIRIADAKFREHWDTP